MIGYSSVRATIHFKDINEAFPAKSLPYSQADLRLLGKKLIPS